MEVKEESIQSFVKIAKDNIGSQQDNINKLIYLRRLLELINPGSMAYEMLSSLFHKREQPLKKSHKQNLNHWMMMILMMLPWK